jgi:hypothetical protein
MNYNENQIPVLKAHYLNGIEISSFSYCVTDFEVFNKIGFRVMLISKEKLPIEMKYVVLDGIYYKMWGNDDTFIINFIASKMNLVVDPIYFNNTIPTGVNGLGCTIDYTDLVIQDGNIIYPNYVLKNSFGIIVNYNQVPVSFEILDYDSYGNMQMGNRVLIGADGNPMLPNGYYVDKNGLAKTADGKRIIIIFPVNTPREPIPEPVIEPVFQTEPPSVVVEPVAETPVVEEPVSETPVSEEPVTEEPVSETPVSEEPVAETPVSEEPVTEEPVSETPVSEEPVSETPVTETPVSEEPVSETPVTETPVSETPVSEEPAAEEPVAETPVSEEPVSEEPVSEEPVAETPVSEEPVSEEPVAETQ